MSHQRDSETPRDGPDQLAHGASRQRQVGSFIPCVLDTRRSSKDYHTNWDTRPISRELARIAARTIQPATSGAVAVLRPRVPRREECHAHAKQAEERVDDKQSSRRGGKAQHIRREKVHRRRGKEPTDRERGLEEPELFSLLGKLRIQLIRSEFRGLVSPVRHTRSEKQTLM